MPNALILWGRLRVDSFVSGNPREPPLSTARVKGTASKSTIPPISNVYRAYRTSGCLTGKASKPLAKIKVGSESFKSLGSMEGMLIAFLMRPPCKTSATASAISTPTLSWASAVEAPKCGVRLRFSIFRSSWSSGRGSSS